MRSNFERLPRKGVSYLMTARLPYTSIYSTSSLAFGDLAGSPHLSVRPKTNRVRPILMCNIAHAPNQVMHT